MLKKSLIVVGLAMASFVMAQDSPSSILHEGTPIRTRINRTVSSAARALPVRHSLLSM